MLVRKEFRKILLVIISHERIAHGIYTLHGAFIYKIAFHLLE